MPPFIDQLASHYPIPSTSPADRAIRDTSTRALHRELTAIHLVLLFRPDDKWFQEREGYITTEIQRRAAEAKARYGR